MTDDWLEDAACNGLNTDRFVIDDKRQGRGHYTNPKTRAKLANALAVCHACPVIAECAAYMQTWDTPPRDIVIAGLAPRDAWRAWHTAHGHPHRRTA